MGTSAGERNLSELNREINTNNRDCLSDEDLNYVTFDTEMGWVGISGSTRGLRRITLPQPSAQEACQRLGDGIKQASWSPGYFQDLIKQLKMYFSGHKTTFPDKLDLSGATTFQHEVWQATRLIPYGETRSYTWVANQINKPRAVQAVGQALARNPLPIIIPCHRVLTVNGELGGYSGGVKMKRRLLQLEASAKSR